MLLFSIRAYAEKPMLGIIGIDSMTPKGKRLSFMLEEHLHHILYSTSIFDMVNTDLMKDQLIKFNCLEEKCIIRFGRDAGIGVIILGNVDERGDNAVITLRALGLDVPYDGKHIYSCSVEIPLYQKYSSTEYSYICEEQAGYFVSSFLKRYQMPVPIHADRDGVFRVDRTITGTFSLYRLSGTAGKDRPRLFAQVGRVRFKDGAAFPAARNTALRHGDFILMTFKEKSSFISNFYYGRKREIVFKESSPLDVFYMFLFTGPASATMPIVAPVFGYYRNSDWLGLSLWALNVAPYLYLEINGFVNYPHQFRHDRRNIPRHVMAQWHFAWYFAFAGGAALFVDAFAHGYLRNSSRYLTKASFLGNDRAAGYLALVSGGAGHFYRGRRFWGYVYFHINNALLYLLINEFSPGERYDWARRKYVKESVNETRAYTYLGIFCAVKVVEVIHAVFLKDRIHLGTILDESSSLEPIFYFPEAGECNVGMRCNYRF